MRLWYMNDNHTFRELTPVLDIALKEVEAQLLKGFTSGSLFARTDNTTIEPSLHLSFSMPHTQAMQYVRTWLETKLKGPAWTRSPASAANMPGSPTSGSVPSNSMGIPTQA